MALPTSMQDLSTSELSNSPAESDAITSSDSPADYLRNLGAIIRFEAAKGSDIASATTTDLSTATAQWVDVTGTATITGLGTLAAGLIRWVRFTGASVLTHNATSLILLGAANRTNVSGNVSCFRSLGSGNWQEMVFSGANQTTPLISVSISGATALTAPAIDDALPIYDLSATSNKQIALTDLWKVINLFTEDASPNSSDFLASYDTSAGAAKKVSLANLLALILPDADKGDIVVSSNGTVWTIDSGVVTYAKIQNVSAASRLLGRGSSGGSGSTQEISLGTSLSMSGTTINCSALSSDVGANAVGTISILNFGGGGSVLHNGTTAGANLLAAYGTNPIGLSGTWRNLSCAEILGSIYGANFTGIFQRIA